jgi:hypothetical protein
LNFFELDFDSFGFSFRYIARVLLIKGLGMGGFGFPKPPIPLFLARPFNPGFRLPTIRLQVDPKLPAWPLLTYPGRPDPVRAVSTWDCLGAIVHFGAH